MKTKNESGMLLKSCRTVVAVFIFTGPLLVVGASPLNNDTASIPEVVLRGIGGQFQMECLLPNTTNSMVWFVKTSKGTSYLLTSDLLLARPYLHTSITYDNRKKAYEFSISNVTSGDEGLYRCELVELPEKPGECVKRTTSSQIELKVLYPPEITNISISANVVHEGSPVTLECYATGYPEPIVFWRRVDNEKINSVGVKKYPKNVLKIFPALRNDSGVYECVADNALVVSPNRSVKLSVFAKKQLPTEKYDEIKYFDSDEE